MTSLWKNYDANSSYDEYLTPEKKLRREAKIISSILDKHGKKKLQEIDRNCMSTIDSRGINFKVYSADKKAAEEKKWPLDIIPRIVLKSKWNKVKKGLMLLIYLLMMFIIRKEYLKIKSFLKILFLSQKIISNNVKVLVLKEKFGHIYLV